MVSNSFVVSFASSPNSSYTSTEGENTLMQPEGTQDMRTSNTIATNATTKPNIVLFHGGWADGGSGVR